MRDCDSTKRNIYLNDSFGLLSVQSVQLQKSLCIDDVEGFIIRTLLTRQLDPPGSKLGPMRHRHVKT
jgi:hypothetical protein